jgi:hexosaminidase
VPTPIGATDTKLTGNHFKLHYSPSVQGSKVYYSLDGYTPTTLHRTMDEPLEITVPKGAERILKTVVITSRGRRSVVVTTVLKNN